MDKIITTQFIQALITLYKAAPTLTYFFFGTITLYIIIQTVILKLPIFNKTQKQYETILKTIQEVNVNVSTELNVFLDTVEKTMTKIDPHLSSSQIGIIVDIAIEYVINDYIKIIEKHYSDYKKRLFSKDDLEKTLEKTFDIYTRNKLDNSIHRLPSLDGSLVKSDRAMKVFNKEKIYKQITSLYDNDYENVRVNADLIIRDIIIEKWKTS